MYVDIIYMYIYIHYVHKGIYVYTYMYMYTYIYIHTIHAYVYVYIYVYTYIHTYVLYLRFVLKKLNRAVKKRNTDRVESKGSDTQCSAVNRYPRLLWGGFG